MATIKRMSRISKGTGLTEGQRGNLIGGMAGLLTLGPDEPQPLFDSEAERRQAWEKNRTSLIRECVATEGAGLRPAAFWEYEALLPAAENLILTRHEYLIKNNLLFIGELAGIIKEWKRDLAANSEKLQTAYQKHKAGEPADRYFYVHEYMTVEGWQGLAAKWASEAALYGPEAVKAWESMKKAVEEGQKK